ncbi:hypothetical protein NA57DRAFT_65327 [Rhizodiscina lignyota]|uniref:Galactose oxidase n=1 Tax=Rhizodiscina lignyota TaxID=1504668 RepID=A0A9P4MCU8_9PEZI|nr:hypothetical protein NA57DRAFT_65327 [Rhizodiscina lignyota]
MVRLLQLPAGLLLLSVAHATAQLPYNPTRIFRSSRNDTLAYLFQPSSNYDFKLSALDTSITLGIDDVPIITLYSSLPFLAVGTSTAFSPAIDQNGIITAYAGNCGGGSPEAALWRFEPIDSDSNGNGTWTKQTFSSQDKSGSATLDGANFLASGLAFSSIADGDSDFYLFGGMCPLQEYNAGPDSWQSSANYSNLLLSFTRDSSSASSSPSPFSLNAAPTGNKPIAEAGFTVTGLAPTFSNETDGTQTQQQNFVMIGGHTQAAFINMSQVALFSLPQGTWNFLPIDQPSGGHTDLAVRDGNVDVEPRSGHSAVLSLDGNSIFVFGGWIGNVNTPANPQLAVLNIGEGYGGSGSWSWTVPQQTGTAPANIYGHDALMLSGDVMMIIGGYKMSSSSSKFRRRDAMTQNSKAYFFNVSSNSWISSYDPPEDTVVASDTGNGGLLSTTSQKAGLAVGLGIGALAIIALLVFYLWYRRRLHGKREARKDQIRQFSFGTHRPTTSTGSAEIAPGVDYYGDGPYSEKHISSPNPSNMPHGWRSTSGHDAERTGLLLDIPSPTRGLRKGVATRNGYQAAPRYDERRLSIIHPIEESDEEHISGAHGSIQALHQKKRSEASTVSNATTLDPFTEHNPLRSHPVGNSPTEQFDQSIHPSRPTVARAHSKDAETFKDTGGRISPSKSDRTSSTLSDNSARTGSLARNLSIRSSGLWNALGLGATVENPFTTPDDSPTQEHPQQNLSDAAANSSRRQRRESHSSGSRPNTKESADTNSSAVGAESFHSAHSRNPTGFAKLQAESEALLGSHRPADPGYDFTSISYNNTTPGTSPTRQDRPQSRPGPSTTITGGAMSMFGSVRRVLTIRRANPGQRSASMTTRSPLFSTRPRSGTLQDSALSSPTKHKNGNNFAPPRRAASDAGFWKAKRGARDWGGVMESWDDPDDEWDVERAAESRNVQVMFTVPRERLRVVNADVDGRSLLSSVDDEAVEERDKKEKKDGLEMDKREGSKTM